MTIRPLDAVDLQIRDARQKEYLSRNPVIPRVGDYVIFADGVIRRISHCSRNEVQTSDIGKGSYYIFGEFLSFSGSLCPFIPTYSLSLSNELKDGNVWFFSHNEAGASRGIVTTIKCFVWHCNLPAN